MEKKNGENKIISFYAKKARGIMARFIIENRVRKIKTPKNLMSRTINFKKNYLLKQT